MIINTPINHLGYGRVGYQICKTLSAQNKLEAIFPIGDPELDLYSELQTYDWRIMGDYPKGPVVRIWHQHDVHNRLNGDFSHTGFPFFELDNLVNVERLSMNSCDKIYVASEWAKQVCIDNNIDAPISVVPLGVDRSIFNEHNNVSHVNTVFFNCGKWEIRKGHDVLLQAFKKAFEPQDSVELWMMCDIPFENLKHINDHWHNYYMQDSRYKIRLIPRQSSHSSVYNVMRKVDCGVFPARAEGWNLEALELLSCGKHLIITDYSAHTEYVNEYNSKRLHIKELESAHDGIWFNGQGRWAKITDDVIDQMVEHMRSIHKSKQEGQLHQNDAGIQMAQHLSWENTIQKMQEG